MSANWWEAAPLVNEPTPEPAKKKKEQNWWEEAPLLGEAVTPAAPEVAPAPQRSIGFGPLALLRESLPAVTEGVTSLFRPETYQGVGTNIPLTAELAILTSNLETIDNSALSPEQKQQAQTEILQKIQGIQQQIQANTPEGLNFLQAGVRGGLESLPPMLIGTAASVATRSPVPALATAGALTRTQSYGEARSEGLDPGKAALYADLNAAIEVGLEGLPTQRLLDVFDVKDTPGLKKKVIQFAIQEGATEQATTALQTLNALAFQLDEELANAESPLEAAKIQAERQAVTAVATVVGGGTQAAGVGALNKVQRDRLLKKTEEAARDIEGIGAEAELNAIAKAREDALNAAANITAPDVAETQVEPGQVAPTPFQQAESYADKIFNSVGQFIPTNAEFKVETKDIDGTPSIVVTDQNGRQFGQVFQNQEQADQLALSLNNLTKARADVLKGLEPLGTSLRETMKGFGLEDVGLRLDTKIFGRRGEAMTSEGLFDPVVRQVFLAVDAVDPAGTLTADERRVALSGVLRHEVVHALRYLDLWKKTEWKSLEKAASSLKKQGTDQTYLDVAKENYSDQNQVVQIEEAIADMIRDVADRRAKVAGRPRSLSERAVNFFDKAKNALTGAGFQTYEDVINRFEQGVIGARQRGQIRTLRAVEERAAEKGEVPERLQRLFTNPEERNKFRDDTVQNLWGQTQPSSPFAANALRTSGIRESRSFIDPVPAKITVDNQEFPTRDSENRLIYSGYEGPEVFGMETRPTQEGLQNFWRSFKGSKAVDQQGRPQLYLHGTAGDITAFRPKQAGAVFVTRNIPFAESFGDLSNTHMIVNFPDFIGEREVLDVLNESMRSATTPKFYDRLEKIQKRVATRFSQGKGLDAKSITDIKELYTGKKVLGKTDIADGVSSSMIESIEKRLPSNANLVPVYVNAQNPFDYENSDDIKRVIKRVKEISPVELDSGDIEGLRKGDWVTIEGLGEASPILDAIKSLGYDSMYIEESGIKNLAVFNPNQIKSAIGNNGNFDITTPSIRESRVPRGKTVEELETEIAALDRGEQERKAKRDEVKDFAKASARQAFDARGDYRDLQDSIDSNRENIRDTLNEGVFGEDAIDFESDAFDAFDAEVERLRQKEGIASSIRESRKEPTYNIINSRTGEVVGQANTINGARRAVDRRDNQYGASVHTIQVVDAEEDRAQRERSRARLGLPPLTPSIRESRVRNPQLDTPEFQRFFRNSKVVDEANQPLVVYHGTDRDIDAFKASRDGGALGTGIYFSPSAEFAGQYAQREGGNVVPAYVSLKNPLVIDGSLSQDPMIEALMRLGVPQNKANSIVERAYDTKGYITTEVKSRAQKEGFDGILQYKNGQLGEVVAFNPNQIKSAVGNIGAFDITRPSIRESRPETVRAPKKRNELIVRELFDYSTDDKGRLIVKKNIDKARQLAKKVAKPKVDKDGALVFKAADADDVVNALNNMPTADVSIASQVARRLNLSEEEINATSLPFQTGEPTNRAFDTEFIGELPDVVQYLEDRRLESGLRPLNIASEEDQDVLARLIAAETLGAIRSSGNALEWYDETIGKALGIASLKYPELQSDPNAQGIFTIAMAISSQGLNVENNFKFTFKQYDAFRRTGRFPETGEGEASGAMAKNFKLANDLMDEFGDIGTLRRFLATPFSVEELRRTGFNITDELGDEMVLGSSVFGPKIGFGFYSNLNGNFEPVTMDMWFMRLIGRLIGKLKQFDPDLFAEQLVTFRNSLDERGKQGIYADRFDADLVSRAKTDDEAALELARRVKKAHEKDFKTNRAEFDAGERSKTQLVNSSDRLINSVDKPKDAPANGTERRNLRSVVRKAVAEVERIHGERIPPAAMQALIWYPEQELYSALGVSLPVTSQDYAGAAQKLLEEEGYDLPTIRAAAESGARRTRQVAGKSVRQRPEEVGAEPQRSIPFEGREREEFIRRRYERTELEKERVAPRRKKVLFEVAPDPNNKPLTEAWRSLDNAVRLAISERIVQDMVPKVLSEFDTSGLLVNQVGSYLEDTNPSFALLLDKGDVVEVSKALGFALSQDSMMIVSPKEFKGGDLVNSITVELGNVSPQEIESIYNRLREIEVDGKNPVGGQTFTNGGMTILNYSDVDTATLADLIDSQLANKYTVYKSKVYSAFPEKKDYDYASERDDGRGQKAVLRKRLRDLRAEATNAVQEQLQGIATQGRAAAPAEAVVPRAREARRRRPPGETPLGPTVPGPSTDSDTTAASEALNEGQPTNGLGMPTGPLVTDTMPDNTVDISRARLEPLTRRLIRTVEFFQSAPDKLRSGVGLTDIAKRIEDYYDTYAERLGIVNGIIREANKNISFGGKRGALDTFEEFIRARENGRTDEAATILNNASESDRQLIDAWNQIAEETGRVNLSVRTPNGQPMKVYDPNLVTGTYGEKVGGFRPIRAVKQFFPRTLRREVLEVMMNSDKDPALYNELLDALIASGRVETREEADNYLTKEWFSDEIKQDYFAGVEKARTDPLPEVFYDYSWDAATRYLRKWARRTSQIQYFGQEMGQFQKDWFDTNIPKVRDDETQEYLNEIKNRIYEIESFDFISNVGNWLNSLATATQLGNPVSASLNLLGGTITNVQEFGIKEIAKSYADLLLDWKKVQAEGTRLGILNTDVMNILSDHVEQDAQKYFSKTQRVSEALAKFTNTMLTFGGFNGAENVVRASAMLAARSWLNDSLIAVNENPGSSKAKKFYEWVNRENLNAEQLILENGSGPETAKFMRRAVNVPQGSYKIDMTPVFVDTTAGRFFLKYQKFGTQINRFFYRHFLKPFIDNPTPTRFLRIAGFLGSAIVGGGAILAIREAFGYGDPGPDDEEIKKALENEDLSRAWALIFSRAWQNITAAGSMGNFGNYLQFSLDWQDQLKPKNPLSPPGLASIESVADLFNRIRDQKSFSAKDLDEIAENTLSFYRAYKRIGLASLEEMGSDAKAVKAFATRKEVREIRELSRRYSDEMEMEYKRRTAPGSIVRTPMTPINRKVIDALYAGDGVLAREIIREAQKGLPRKEREKIIRSIQSAARNAQPIQIAGVSPSREIRRDFDRWARRNLPREKVQLINRVDRNYKRAARLAGLKIGE